MCRLLQPCPATALSSLEASGEAPSHHGNHVPLKYAPYPCVPEASENKNFDTLGILPVGVKEDRYTVP